MIRLAVRVRREDAEVALAELIALAPSGVEEVDLGDRVEYAIYGAPGELPELPDLEAAAGDALVEISTSEVADDWGERWKAFHEPVQIGPLRVRPPWAEGRDGDIVIDPGQAFGTGGHQTTRLCIELLLDLEPAGPLADLGCGSGVLAIAAAKLGFGPIVALDFDPLAVDATAQNVRDNSLADVVVEGPTTTVSKSSEIQIARWDLRTDPAPAAPTVVANLLRPLLLQLRFADEPPEVLIASGLLVAEAQEAADHFSAVHGLYEQRRLESGDWAALLLRKRS